MKHSTWIIFCSGQNQGSLIQTPLAIRMAYTYARYGVSRLSVELHRRRRLCECNYIMPNSSHRVISNPVLPSAYHFWTSMLLLSSIMNAVGAEWRGIGCGSLWTAVTWKSPTVKLASLPIQSRL